MSTSAAALTVIGEALIDVVHRAVAGHREMPVETPGGSPANVALALARLGRRPVLRTALGGDARGERVRAWLADAGVDVVVNPLARTSTAVARLDAKGVAQYEFDLDWRLGEIPEAAALTGIVHVGSVAVHLEPGATVVRRVVEAARRHALVAYDPNIRPSLLGDRAAAAARVDEFIGLSDVVKASDEDLAWLRPGADPLDVAREWLTRGPRLVVVTRGGRGALGVTAAHTVEVASTPVTVVDTVGAGDTFMAALIDGLLTLGIRSAADRDALALLPEGMLHTLLTDAAAAAAVTVSRPGADPPWRAELAPTLSRATSAFSQ